MNSTLAQGCKVTAWRAGRTLCETLAALGMLVGFAGLAAAQTTAPKSAAPLAVTIDARQTTTPTSNYEFGMFIEHIGPSDLSQPVVGDARRSQVLFPDQLAAERSGEQHQVFPGCSCVSGGRWGLTAR